jgi:DNA-binding NarL/FixJ family response regulator
MVMDSRHDAGEGWRADAPPALLSYWSGRLRNVTANGAHMEWFGVSPDDMRGRHLRDVIGSEAFLDLQPHISGVLMGAPRVFERTVPSRAGAVRARVAAVPDIVAGRVLGFSAFVTLAPSRGPAGALGVPAPAAKVRVLVVDPDTVARTGLGVIFSGAPDIEVVAEASTAEDALAAVWSLRPDIIVMDLRMPGTAEVLAARRSMVADGSPFPKVVMLTMSAFDEFLFDPIGDGASGVLIKSSPSEALIAGVRAAASSDAPGGAGRAAAAVHEPLFARAPWRPTPREREVLELVIRGFSNPEIARRLFVSIDTVKTHLRHLYDKLGVRDRQQLIATGYEFGRL